MADSSWRDRAECRTADPHWFDIDGHDAQLKLYNQWAYALCASCPVLAECDEWADEVDVSGLIVAGKVRTSTTAELRREARAQWADRKLEPLADIACEGCGTTFKPRTASHRCCSDTCRRAASRRRDREQVAA